jgi:Sulfotransferase domain
MADNSIISPSVFILGAPKCGTTSLASYLTRHPEIAPPRIKEPNFFSTDLPMLQEVSTKDDYLELFTKENDSQIVSFEASTWYLYSKEAAKNILQFCPKAKLIVMIRNPIEMVQSLHSQQVYNLNENITNFEEAWRLQDTRTGEGQWLLHYKNCCQTGTQLETLLNTANESQVKTILFDDFKSNPQNVFLDIQKFIGLTEFKLDDYSSKNKNKALRSRKLQNFLKKTPEPVKLFWTKFKILAGIHKLGLFDKIEKINNKEITRADLSSELKEELSREFAYEIEKLEVITGKNLAHWKV